MKRLFYILLISLFILSFPATIHYADAKGKKTTITTSKSKSNSSSTSKYKTVKVKSYTKKDGTKVKAHKRSAPKSRKRK